MRISQIRRKFDTPVNKFSRRAGVRVAKAVCSLRSSSLRSSILRSPRRFRKVSQEIDQYFEDGHFETVSPDRDIQLLLTSYHFEKIRLWSLSVSEVELIVFLLRDDLGKDSLRFLLPIKSLNENQSLNYYIDCIELNRVFSMNEGQTFCLANQNVYLTSEVSFSIFDSQKIGDEIARLSNCYLSWKKKIEERVKEKDMQNNENYKKRSRDHLRLIQGGLSEGNGKSSGGPDEDLQSGVASGNPGPKPNLRLVRAEGNSPYDDHVVDQKNAGSGKSTGSDNSGNSNRRKSERRFYNRRIGGGNDAA